MEPEETKLPKKALEKFTYDPDSLDICRFTIVVDKLHWKLLCKHAFDLTTTPDFIHGVILEKYLINIGYLDPRAPTSEPSPLSVTIRDVRDNSDLLDIDYNIAPNYLLRKKKDKDPDEKKPKGRSDFLKGLLEGDDND